MGYKYAHNFAVQHLCALEHLTLHHSLILEAAGLQQQMATWWLESEKIITWSDNADGAAVKEEDFLGTPQEYCWLDNVEHQSVVTVLC